MFVADEVPLPGAGFRVTTRLVFLVAANWTIRGEEDDAPGPRPRSFSPFDQWCLQVKDGAGAPGGAFQGRARRGERRTRRCRRHLDLDAGTLAIEPTRVVVDGRVIESDGKTENAQHVLALDPFTLAVLKAHVAALDRERAEFGPDYQDSRIMVCCTTGKTGSLRIRIRSRDDSSGSRRRRVCRRSTCTTCGTATPQLAAMQRSTGKRSASASATPTWRSP